MHTPVLLKEAIEGLNVRQNGLYIDATVGEGGHLFEITKRGGKALGIDWDEKQINRLNVILGRSESDDSRIVVNNNDSGQVFRQAQDTEQSRSAGMTNNIILVQGNFADIEEIAKKNKFYPVDGVIFDLGLSMGQIDNSKRGFSYNNLAERLDMRLDSRLKTTAADLINSLNQDQIYEILARYGEEINSLAISRALVRARSLKKIKTVGDVVKIIDRAIEKKDKRTYARVFQALRIAVNNELKNLKKGLEGTLKITKKDGRIVVISFHSLEDRIVKQFIKQNNLRQMHKKVIKSNYEKVFERSAKLRIIER
ncbi:16S rRNA (cytosine(1402)-N(4))-methyltransferase RsmH [Candidatus Roizmanbacteria bacterium]|nr:16S rRNA (cytosine(1402)-N(4))-methyltransferase RsmH [Candidatus Roizmanbacteria bacterium]